MLGLRDSEGVDGGGGEGGGAGAVALATAGGGGGGGGGVSRADNPFFCYYASLVHQQNMLQDLVRTGAYQSAILQNEADFRGKVVVDVGTGSGVLAYFAARAGARHVYALEASGAAVHARRLLEANGFGDRVTVLQCRVEDAALPEKADVIISEPMGFMLIHERMLESFIVARQRFLKPEGGRMYPSRGDVRVTLFSDPSLHAEQLAKLAFWGATDFFGMDLTPLMEAAADDHFAQPVVGYVDPATLLSDGVASHRIDFAADDPASLQRVEIPFALTASRAALCHGLAAWFDVDFMGSATHVTLSTGPRCPGTHWYQCRILLRYPIAVNAGQTLKGTLTCVANARFSYDMKLRMVLQGSAATTASGQEVASEQRCSLADQMYTLSGQQTPAAQSSEAGGH